MTCKKGSETSTGLDWTGDVKDVDGDPLQLHFLHRISSYVRFQVHNIHLHAHRRCSFVRPSIILALVGMSTSPTDLWWLSRFCTKHGFVRRRNTGTTRRHLSTWTIHHLECVFFVSIKMIGPVYAGPGTTRATFRTLLVRCNTFGTRLILHIDWHRLSCPFYVRYAIRSRLSSPRTCIVDIDDWFSGSNPIGSKRLVSEVGIHRHVLEHGNRYREEPRRIRRTSW